MKVQQTIVAKCPNLAVPHRRLVCYCRLYEVNDPHKKERPGKAKFAVALRSVRAHNQVLNFLGLHQREVFLFNDLLVITKIHSRKKNTVTYTFRQSYLLAGMVVSVFETQFYPYGIQMSQKWDRKIVLTLNARYFNNFAFTRVRTLLFEPFGFLGMSMIDQNLWRTSGNLLQKWTRWKL